MKTYIGTKIIQAEFSYKNGDEGYKVVYPDGYTSWSPKEAFEEAYRRADGMNFGLAFEAMRKGLKVARKGWNGKNMFIYLVEGTIVPVENLRGNCAEAVAMSKNTAPVQNICGHIDMLAADGSVVVGWLASQTDMLSDDWEVIT